MILTRPFLEILKQKLSFGNSRSILLNVIPGKLLSRIALTDIDIIKPELSKQFLETLTTQQSFRFNFSLALENNDDDSLKKLARLGKRLSAIKYDYDDYIKEHGIETFGLGFPIFVRKNPKDASKYIAAPVFIFPLDIKQSFDKSREWIISRDNESEIRLNEVLSSFIENEEHIKIPLIPEEMLEDAILDKSEIQRFCKELLSKFSDAGDASFQGDKLDILPDKISDFSHSSQTRIIWNGVFGLYKSQKQNLLKEVDTLLDIGESLPNSENGDFEWEQSHSPVSIDPSQNGVLRSLSGNRNVVIEGPPGTGKSQTLTAIISSALSNGKKVLVVCEKRTALEVLKTNLQNLIPEMSQSIALIEDVVRDRTQIVESVRSRTANYLASQHYLKNILQSDINDFEETANHIEAQYKALRSPIWRNLKWKELVSKWVGIRATDIKVDKLHRLSKIFDEQAITDEEYATLHKRVKEGSIIFSKIKSSYDDLNVQIKIPGNIDVDLERHLTFGLKEQLTALTSRREVINGMKAEIEDLVSQEVASQIKSCCDFLTKLGRIQAIYEGSQIDIFALTKIIRFKAIFSKKYRVIVDDADTAQQLQKEIGQYWSKILDEPFIIGKSSNQITYLSNRTETVSKSKFHRLLDIPANENKNIEPDEWNKLTSAIRDIEKSLRSLITCTPELGAYLTIESLLSWIAQTEQTAQKVLSYQNDFRAFFDWKLFLSQLTRNQLKWIEILINEPSNTWVNILEEAWLYNRLITEDRNGKFPVDDSNLYTLKNLGLQIQKQQKGIVKENLNSWFLAGQRKIKQNGVSINQLFNLRGSKGTSRNSLRKIIHFNLEAFTDFFPVMMLNPSTCSSILPLSNSIFDIVMFDEASQLRIEDTYAALLRGKQVIVSGDSQQMPPSSYFESSAQILGDDDNGDEVDDDELSVNKILDEGSKDLAQKESLLEFAIDSGYKQTYLDMHYRSRHPDLIEFSNVCFYASRLIPMPEKDDGLPIKYIHVNGLYSRRENEKEAVEIVRILKEEIDPTFSVGIATFNLNQRNLIQDLINNERIADIEFRKKMDAWEKLGFFVKNLENIQGDEKDVILISTTFGTNAEGRFILNFGPISQKNGHRLLNVIITRAKYKVYVITSIPEVRMAEYRQRLELSAKVDGATGLLAYLSYAKAISNGQQDEKNNILEFIKSKVSLGKNLISGQVEGHTESPFDEEVFSWLAEVIPTERIKLQYKCGGFRIDMVVFPKSPTSQTKLAIECDGAAYHSDELSWHYDLYRQQQLEENGFVFHRIWSTNWWRRPNEEFQNLLKTIEQIN